MSTYKQRSPIDSGGSWYWRGDSTRGRRYRNRLGSLALLALQKQRWGGQDINQTRSAEEGVVGPVDWDVLVAIVTREERE